uniref:Ubiquitin-like domain-containing protein n=1 Tax=Pyrodinium bahamense TaxID=73915 RepID=A0A7S0BD63_9DINO
MDGESIAIVVLGLSGDVIAEVQMGQSETISDLKRTIHMIDRAKATCWQRLMCHDRELFDQDRVGHMNGAAPIFFTLVVSVDVNKLLTGSSEIVAEVAEAFEAMGKAMIPHMDNLFIDEAGEPLDALIAEEVLNTLGHRLGWVRTLAGLRRVLLPHAMDILRSTALVFRNHDRICRIFAWLGPAASPHLVAWLGLLERPLPPCMIRRVQQLSRFPDCARVRLAAKSALRDKGGHSVARVDELAKLWASLGRDIKALAEEDRYALEIYRSSAHAALCELQAQSTDLRVRYAASRALRR